MGVARAFGPRAPRLLVRIGSSTALVMLCAFAVEACGSLPRPSDFQIGMSRQQVVAAFGEPERRRSLVKSDPSILGPIETFWSSVPSGAEVEIWSYPARGGTVELYFVDGSSEVRGTGFAPEGAVY
jgi:hypothetical protein